MIKWEIAVRQELVKNPPVGWKIIKGIKARGVQLLPEDCVYIHHNIGESDLNLVGKYKIVFELFRLNTSGKIKISARVAGIAGEPLFHEFNGVARALGSPKPKGTKKINSQSVAAWPANLERECFSAENHDGIAQWIRDFLCDPPADFVLFIALARNLLMK